VGVRVEVSPWGGAVPFLIINGHKSQLDPKFLMYINDVGHVWKVCLDILYATNYWQVGDSSQQNRTFKVLWYRENENWCLSNMTKAF
jgi:hypothetical protein